jgi:hypothetical protein
MDGLHTRVAEADSFITTPDPAPDFEIVSTWWHYQVKGTRPHHGIKPVEG